uniref:shikimate dehydrogenase family protein n=1 Tax=Falsiroseomonas sp. TaxID=2870721 RepID=UPI0034A115C8
FALCDTVSEVARRAGSVNTLVFRDGRIEGTSTDGFGFLESIREQAPGWQAADGPAVILGAGGAVRSVAAALLDAGCPHLTLVNRTPARAEAIARELSSHGGGPIAVAATPPLAEAALLVNGTSLGMSGEPPLEIELAPLPPGAVVADMVYVPLETPLLAAARARGLRAVDGLGMLLHQARPGFEAWFGVAPQVDAALRAFILDDLR